MIRQHDAAGTHADGRGAASEITDDDGGRGAGNARHVVMFGHPVARVTKRFGMLSQIQALGQGLAWCFTEDDRNEVENRDGTMLVLLMTELIRTGVKG